MDFHGGNIEPYELGEQNQESRNLSMHIWEHDM